MHKNIVLRLFIIYQSVNMLKENEVLNAEIKDDFSGVNNFSLEVKITHIVLGT